MPHDPFYTSKNWRDTRLKALRRDRYICQDCGVKCLGKRKNAPAPHVDHTVNRKKRPDLALHLPNLRTLCPACHNIKTKKWDVESKAPPIGLDGFPIEVPQK
jgi:5-methylcytosine-specific restriction protein A